MVTLSIVMPAYNEAAHIDTCVREWYEQVIAAIPDSELLVVDDCSSDGTGARLEFLTTCLPRLHVLRTPRNVGHGPAVLLGLENCSGEFVFQTDSDRQHTPDDFPKLWDRRDQADFLFGVREQRADGPFRIVVSGILRTINFLIWGQWITDANCPFKLMRRSALAQVISDVPRDCFIPMVVVSLLARRRGFRSLEIPVQHFARTAGEQSLAGLRKWGRVGARCAGDLLALRFAAVFARAQAENVRTGNERIRP
jgi:glycosyltransferase involved in cell wall biosynthesis